MPTATLSPALSWMAAAHISASGFACFRPWSQSLGTPEARMSERHHGTVRIAAELIDEVRRTAGRERFLTEVVAEALRLWLAANRAGKAPSAHQEALGRSSSATDQPWSNAYKPPATTRATTGAR